MNFFNLFCTASLAVSLAFFAQAPHPKDLTDNKGTIVGENTYNNPALRMTIALPGTWHFFNRTKYSTAESKQRDEEIEREARSGCQGPLCGGSEMDVALESPAAPPPVHSIFLTAFKLSVEYQNRNRYPLKRFAEVMGPGSLGDNWIPEGDLTAIQLDGKPAYRLIVHHKRTVTTKGFLYVADSNGRVFMLLGTAMSEPEKLQSAIENMKLTNTRN